MTSKKTPAKNPVATKYKLKHPLEWGKETVMEIEFSRPKGKHLKHIGSNPTIDDAMKIAVKVAVGDFTPAFFDELDAEDYLGVSDIVQGFLDGGRGIGETAK